MLSTRNDSEQSRAIDSALYLQAEQDERELDHAITRTLDRRAVETDLDLTHSHYQANPELVRGVGVISPPGVVRASRDYWQAWLAYSSHLRGVASFGGHVAPECTDPAHVLYGAQTVGVGHRVPTPERGGGAYVDCADYVVPVAYFDPYDLAHESALREDIRRNRAIARAALRAAIQSQAVSRTIQSRDLPALQGSVD